MTYVPSCAADFVKVFDGHSLSESSRLTTRCGTSAPYDFYSSDNEMAVQFVTDAVHETFSGFKMYASVSEYSRNVQVACKCPL